MRQSQITVIIATLGIYKNFDLINNLSKSNLVKKIIISLPLTNRKIFYNSNKVRFFYNWKKNQVFQRISALKNINTKYLLYLDDDVYFDFNFVNLLLQQKLKSGANSIIAPVYYDKISKKKIHSSEVNFLKKILQSILLGISFKRAGKISKAGTCYGVDPDNMPGNTVEVDWIPGGCILLDTKNVIKKNYFKGDHKALCEDLIMSFLFKKKKLKLFVTKKAKLFTYKPGKISSKKDLIAYLNGLKNYCTFANCKNLNYFLWIFYLNFKLFILTKFKYFNGKA